MQPTAIDLRTVTTGDTLSGLVLIKEYTKKNMANNQPLKGTLHYQGKDLEFSVWKTENCFPMFQDGDLKNHILHVIGNVTEYQNKQAININGVDFTNTYTDYTPFYKSLAPEKVTQLESDMLKVVATLRQGYQNVLNTVLFHNAELYKAYKSTWAGAKMHDAYNGGLLHHTVKILRLAQMLIYNDNRLAPFANLIYTSIILHDIGKIHEIALDGTYTKHSYVTHRTIGVEMVAGHKSKIVEEIGMDDYYQILAVIQGHHGEYGDKPTTITTYIIHLMDMLEATTTGILDKIENGEERERNGNKTVWVGTDYPNLVV